MDTNSFKEFVTSSDTLRIYKDGKLIFVSQKKRLLPLMDYIDGVKNGERDVLIMDKLVGNAAALLMVVAEGREVISPVGSEIAVKTLEHFGIKHNLVEIVPQVISPEGGN